MFAIEIVVTAERMVRLSIRVGAFCLRHKDATGGCDGLAGSRSVHRLIQRCAIRDIGEREDREGAAI